MLSPGPRISWSVLLALSSCGSLGCEVVIGAEFDVKAGSTGSATASSGVGSGAGGSGGGGGGAGGQSSDVLWAKTIGSIGIYDYGTGVAVGATGDVFVAGVFMGGGQDFGCPSEFSSDYYGQFIARIQPSGSCVWLRTPGPGLAQDLALDADGNLVVAGAFQGGLDYGGGELPWAGGEEIFVGHLSSEDGADLGSFSFGTAANEYAQGAVPGPDGSLYIVGHYSGSTNLGSTPETALAGSGSIDAFVAKIDASGSAVWARGFPDPAGEDGLSAIALTDDGKGVVVAGAFHGTISFGGFPLASKGGLDVVVLRLDAAHGQVEWARSFGAKGDDQAFGLAVTGDHALVTGWFSGEVDVGNSFLLQSDQSEGDASDIFLVDLYGSNGLTNWGTRFGGPKRDGGFSLAIAPGGDVILSGEFRDTMAIGDHTLVAHGDEDVFIARLPPEPVKWGVSTIWARSYGGEGVVGPDEERARKVAVAPDGSAIAVTGTYGLTAKFGSTTLTSLGHSDAFVARLAP